MGKVLMPLLSLEARNQIGQALVFFPWKGINAVRSYVVPANPKTAAQQAWRAKFAELVLQWRTLGYTSYDRIAYDAWALLDVRPMAGYNKYMSLALDVLAKDEVFTHPYNLTAVWGAPGTMTVRCKVKDDLQDLVVTGWMDTAQGGTLKEETLVWDEPTTGYKGEFTGVAADIWWWIRVRAQKVGFDGWIGDTHKKSG